MSKRVNTHIGITIVLTIFFPAITGFILNTFLPLKWISIPLHSALEVSGGVIAVIISMIFYVKYKAQLVLTHFNWSTTALLSMGIIDIFHGSVMPGNIFVWLHSTAVLFGGIFFMSVWLKEIHVSKRAYRIVPALFLIFPIVFSILSIYFSTYVPDMLNPDKTFTTTANLLNIVGGVGFFIAAIKYVQNYTRTQHIDELLFAGHTMLFGIAGVLFVSSEIWDMQWWLWHILRLMAYLIAFYFLYIEYKHEVAFVENTNMKLNEANKNMREYIEIVDNNVITSTTDLNGKITAVSQAFCDISGYTKDELIGHSHSIVRHPDMPRKLYKDMWNTIKNGKQWMGEMKNRKKDGSFYWVDSTITPQFKNNQMYCYTAVRHDITDKKEVERLSITDELTGLFNRRYFNEVMEKEIKRAKRDGKDLSLIMMDIDHFKQYNDTYGHIEGDYILQKVGKTLLKHTQRASDYAFRLGGEEFAILVTDMDKTKSEEFANIVRESVSKLQIEHKNNSADKYVTISCGVVMQNGKDIISLDNIYVSADTALYKAKENGRNQVVVY